MVPAHHRARPTALVAVLAFLAALAPAVPAAAQAEAPAGPPIVISQVYGGGGNSGATLRNDFIEVFNRGSDPVDLSGWSLQYGSSSGTTWFNRTDLPDGAVVEPGRYYLVQQGAGAGGSEDLPTPDATGSINMSASSGKVALVSTTEALSGACPDDAEIVDFVGYGSANCSEGGGTAPTLDNSTAALRNGGGCVDTDDNATDFTAGDPDPRTTASPLNPCGATGSTDMVISQVYGGGGNSGATLRNDFIELFNRGGEPVDLSGWSVQYASAAGSTWQVTGLSGTVEPGQYYLVGQAAGSGGSEDLPAPDATGSTFMSATNGKVALVDDDAALSGTCPEDVRDFVGFGANANCHEGDGPTATLSNTTAALRNGGGCVDTDDNATDFTAGDPDPRTTASERNPCGIEPPPPPPVTIDCGSAVSTVEGVAATTTVTATSAEASVVDISITGLEPATDSITVTAFQEAAEPGGTATAEVTVGAGTPGGDYAVEVTATDNSFVGDTATCTLPVGVTPILPIGEVQGVVGDDDDGHAHRSPFAPPSGNSAGQEEVAVRGVIYQTTLQRSGNGSDQHGFFLQNTAEAADGDPGSSDGLFVFIGGFDDLRVDGGGFYTPEVGDEVVLRGRVNEFFFLTQLSNPFVVDVTRTGVDVEDELVTADADPPDDVDEAGRYWERREGMRVRVPEGSQAIGGRDVFGGTLDGEVWLVRGDHPVAQRDDPYAQRVFRDAHPLDNNPDADFDDGNGYRIMVGSLGVKAAADDNTELIAPARTFDTVTNAPAGGLYYSFGKFGIQVAEQLELENGVDPSENAPPVAFDRSREYSTAIYNVENLYDHRDDPNDGCDFPGDDGCLDFFGNLSVTPPFDYVPASEEAYEARVERLAEQIVVDLHAPDVLLVQEAEDQDICEADYDALELVCTFDGSDDVSGRPDSLTELALAIERQGGPRYHAVLDRDGADTRGITAGYLYRTDRVELLEPEADDPVLGDGPTVGYRGEPAPYNKEVANPKALNAELPDDVDCTTGCLSDSPYVFARAPQVALFRLWRDGIGESTFTDFYATSNHFSAGPDGRVGQRTEQAAYNAAIADAVRDEDPDTRVMVGGDLNVFPRPDDPFRPGDDLFPSDQLAPLYEAELENLYDTLVAEHPTAAFTFAFQGQAQTLDQYFVNDAFRAELTDIRGAKINADWPAAHAGYGRFGASDHDPEVARFDALPTIERLDALVRHYVEEGRVTGNETERILLDRLARAARFFDRGQEDAARGQLRAFADQIRDFTPRFVDQTASDALVADTLLLLDP